MNNILQKFLFILAIIIISSGIFLGGFILGSSQQLMEDFFHNQSMENAIIEATIAFSHIEKIDQGEVEIAKESMNRLLDSEILVIKLLINDSSHEEYISRAEKLLSRIAEHRKEYPPLNQNSEASQGE
jgi:hypothetical protein